MFDLSNQGWLAKPPLYDCIMIGKKYDTMNGKECSDTPSSNDIQSENSTNIAICKNNSSNLDMYINMKVEDINSTSSSINDKYGTVLNIDGLRRLFDF